MNTTNAFVRITSTDPLVFYVSALSDFLWDDFIRDARPSVRFVEEQYNVTELSRFGKELFDYLYNGGESSTVINLEEAEQYIQLRQTGQSPQAPKGYKPENLFWLTTFLQIAESPAWGQMRTYSIGDQFRAGNNAVNILNNLSTYLYDLITDDVIDFEYISQLTQELDQLREQFIEAKKEGDDAKAAKVRQKGKELGRKIEEELMNANQNIKHKVHESVEKASQETKETEESISALAGLEQGEGKSVDDVEEKRRLAKKLSQNKSLKKLIDRLGSLRSTWLARKRERQTRTNYSDIVGVQLSDNVAKAFPIEMALAATEQGRALFALKHHQKTLMCKDHEARVKELDKGPVIMYIDVSGSMEGESELWSKALACVVAEQCKAEKRDVAIQLFDSRITKSVHLKATDQGNKKLIDFVLGWRTGGGTSFYSVVYHALDRSSSIKNADILMITDGQSNLSDDIAKRLDSLKTSQGVQWNSFCIGKRAEVLDLISDNVYTIDTDADPEVVDMFQDSIR